MGKWQTFKGWHSEATFYREIYTRTLATLTAALVIYLVALAAGLVSARPALVVLILVTVGALVNSIVQMRDLNKALEHASQERRTRLQLMRVMVVLMTLLLLAIAISAVLTV